MRSGGRGEFLRLDHDASSSWQKVKLRNLEQEIEQFKKQASFSEQFGKQRADDSPLKRLRREYLELGLTALPQADLGE